MSSVFLRLRSKRYFMRAAARSRKGAAYAPSYISKRLRAQCSAWGGRVKKTLTVDAQKRQRNHEKTVKFWCFDVAIAAHRGV